MGQISTKKQEIGKRNGHQAEQERIKIVMFGDSGVGKSCFSELWKGNTFPLSISRTIGIDLIKKSVIHKDKKLTLQIWDTASLKQPQMFKIHLDYMKGTHGLIFMYDITSRSSFNEIKDYWHPLTVKGEAQKNKISYILVGNKNDLQKDRQVTYDEGKQLAQNLGMQFIETSAMKNFNIDSTLIKLIQDMDIKNILPKKSDQKQLIPDHDVTAKTIQIVMVGDCNAGKSCFFYPWNGKDLANSNYPESTLGACYLFKKVSYAQKQWKLGIWDTNGLHQKSLQTNKMYVKNALGLIFVYDITDKKSFDSIISFWHPQITSGTTNNFTKMLIGTKLDLQDQRQVSVEQAINFAESLGMIFIEVSTLKNINIQEALLMFVEKLVFDQYGIKQKNKSQLKHQIKPYIGHVQKKQSLLKNQSTQTGGKSVQNQPELLINQILQQKPKMEVQAKEKQIFQLKNQFQILKEKAQQSQKQYERIKQQLEQNHKIKQEAEKKLEQEKKQMNFYEILSQNEISDISIQILRSEDIKTFKELKYLKDQDLKALGIKFGQIARMRQIN